MLVSGKIVFCHLYSSFHNIHEVDRQAQPKRMLELQNANLMQYVSNILPRLIDCMDAFERTKLFLILLDKNAICIGRGPAQLFKKGLSEILKNKLVQGRTKLMGLIGRLKATMKKVYGQWIFATLVMEKCLM